MAPKVSDFVGPGRDDRIINAAVRELRALPAEEARAFVWQLVDHDCVMALRVARRVLRGRRPFEELLQHGFEIADVSTIRFWLDGVLGPLSAERVVELYAQLARTDPARARDFSHDVFPVVRAASREAFDRLTELNRELALDGRRHARPLVDVLVELSGLQEQLLDELHRRFPMVADARPWGWPARVSLEIGDTTWEGFRHGLGYRFASADGRVVEAHDRIASSPYPIDAYRVLEYAESTGVESVWADNGRRVEIEDGPLQDALVRLVSTGWLEVDTRVQHPTGLGGYIVTAPKFRCTRCARGWAVPVRVRATNAAIWVCEACDALWLGHSAPRREPDSTFSAFMAARGLPPRWTEVARRDRGTPELGPDAAFARARELVGSFVQPDGTLAWSSYRMEQVVDEIVRAVGGAPEPLVRAAWDTLAGRPLDKACFWFCKELGVAIHVRRTIHWEWDLTWMLGPARPSQVCFRSWMLAQRRDLWTGELEREANDIFAAHGVG